MGASDGGGGGGGSDDEDGDEDGDGGISGAEAAVVMRSSVGSRVSSRGLGWAARSAAAAEAEMPLPPRPTGLAEAMAEIEAEMEAEVEAEEKAEALAEAGPGAPPFPTAHTRVLRAPRPTPALPPAPPPPPILEARLSPSFGGEPPPDAHLLHVSRGGCGGHGGLDGSSSDAQSELPPYPRRQPAHLLLQRKGRAAAHNILYSTPELAGSMPLLLATHTHRGKGGKGGRGDEDGRVGGGDGGDGGGDGGAWAAVTTRSQLLNVGRGDGSGGAPRVMERGILPSHRTRRALHPPGRLQRPRSLPSLPLRKAAAAPDAADDAATAEQARRKGRRRRAAAAARRERAEVVRHSWRERPPRGLGAAAWRALHDGARERLLQVVAGAFERHGALRAWVCALDAAAAARLCEALAREWEMALRERQFVGPLPRAARDEFEQLTPRGRRSRLKWGTLPPTAACPRTLETMATPLAAIAAIALPAQPRPTALLAAASTAASAAVAAASAAVVAAAAAASTSSFAASAAASTSAASAFFVAVAAAAAPSARDAPAGNPPPPPPTGTQIGAHRALPPTRVLAPPPPSQLLPPPPPPQDPPMRKQYDLVDPSSNQVPGFRPWECDGAAGRGGAGGEVESEGEGGALRPRNALRRYMLTPAEDAAERLHITAVGAGSGSGGGSGAAAKTLTVMPPPLAHRPRRASSAKRIRSSARAAVTTTTSVSRAQAATTTKRYGLETLGDYGTLQTDLLDRELAEIHARERQWADGIAERCTRTTKWLMSAAEGGR